MVIIVASVYLTRCLGKGVIVCRRMLRVVAAMAGRTQALNSQVVEVPLGKHMSDEGSFLSSPGFLGT